MHQLKKFKRGPFHKTPFLKTDMSPRPKQKPKKTKTKKTKQTIKGKTANGNGSGSGVGPPPPPRPPRPPLPPFGGRKPRTPPGGPARGREETGRVGRSMGSRFWEGVSPGEKGKSASAPPSGERIRLPRKGALPRAFEPLFPPRARPPFFPSFKGLGGPFCDPGHPPKPPSPQHGAPGRRQGERGRHQGLAPGGDPVVKRLWGPLRHHQMGFSRRFFLSQSHVRRQVLTPGPPRTGKTPRAGMACFPGWEPLPRGTATAIAFPWLGG